MGNGIEITRKYTTTTIEEDGLILMVFSTNSDVYDILDKNREVTGIAAEDLVRRDGRAYFRADLYRQIEEKYYQTRLERRLEKVRTWKKPRKQTGTTS